jgi:3-phenylpropionate/trans-cinnamate dioxygenase ferredoxin reductase component
VQLSKFYEDAHRARGVNVHVNSVIDSIVGKQSHVTGVRLHNGAVLPAQMVIAGIGIVAAVEPLMAAGALGTNGVEVDESCRTSLEDIYAIGDCVTQANPFAEGAVVRLESIQNATEQATLVAKIITGGPVPQRAVPWFWSNQFDIRLQTVGLSMGHDSTVLRGAPESGRFSVIYLRHGGVAALDCVNSPADFTQGRALVQNRVRISPELLADISRPLKELLHSRTLGSS